MYSSCKYYHHYFSSLQPNRSVVWLWESKCIARIKFFAWLLLNDRLNTRNVLRRRNKYLDEGYNCAICHDGVEETTEHLFFGCSSTACRWFSLGIIWDDDLDIHQKIYVEKPVFPHPFFMEIFLTGAWCIWKERNDLIFNNKPVNLARWKTSFKAEVVNHLHRIKQSFHQSIKLWLAAL